jgi:hypothetical protein
MSGTSSSPLLLPQRNFPLLLSSPFISSSTNWSWKGPLSLPCAT